MTTSNRISRKALKTVFAPGSQWTLVNCLLGPTNKKRTVKRATSYGFVFETESARESELRFQTGDYAVIDHTRDGAVVTIYTNAAGHSEPVKFELAAQYFSGVR